MRFLVTVFAFSLCACTGSAKASPSLNSVADVPLNPISAPSAKVAEKKFEVAPISTPQPTVKKPYRAVFKDMKFSVTLPSDDWKVEVTPQGVALTYEKGEALVFLVVTNDMRALSEIAKEDWAALDAAPLFTVTPLREMQNPDKTAFTVSGSIPDGRKVTMEFAYMRNPGNPTAQTISTIGTWLDGQDEVRSQVRDVMASIAVAL